MKRKNLNGEREYIEGKKDQKSTDFSSEIMQARRQLDESEKGNPVFYIQ